MTGREGGDDGAIDRSIRPSMIVIYTQFNWISESITEEEGKTKTPGAHFSDCVTAWKQTLMNCRLERKERKKKVHTMTSKVKETFFYKQLVLRAQCGADSSSVCDGA